MKEDWTEIELEDSLHAYLEMMAKIRNGEKVIKNTFYRKLSLKHGRTVKSIEYRMQNISYVMELHGRNWISGLVPAKNVGTNVIYKIEKILSIIEQRKINENVLFEAKVNGILNKKFIGEPKGNQNPRRREGYFSDFHRDASVKAWVLKNANGVCENCHQVGPFKSKSGFPYLEVHHVCRLCDNGSDTIENTVALCPNCHKEMHYGSQKHEIQENLYRTIDRLKREN